MVLGGEHGEPAGLQLGLEASTKWRPASLEKYRFPFDPMNRIGRGTAREAFKRYEAEGREHRRVDVRGRRQFPEPQDEAVDERIVLVVLDVDLEVRGLAGALHEPVTHVVDQPGEELRASTASSIARGASCSRQYSKMWRPTTSPMLSALRAAPTSRSPCPRRRPARRTPAGRERGGRTASGVIEKASAAVADGP